MKRLLPLLFLTTSCSIKPEPLEPVCFQQDGITYRAELQTDCPRPLSVWEDVTRVVETAGDLDRWFATGWDAVYLTDDVLWIGTTPVEGAGYFNLERIVITTAGNERAVLRHELFHLALLLTTGDVDYNHTDPRWIEVN